MRTSAIVRTSLIVVALAVLHAVAPTAQQRTGPPPDRGVVENGRYRHFATNIQIDLPPGWTAGLTYGAIDTGESVQLTDTTFGDVVSIWMIREQRSAEEAEQSLQTAPDRKTAQRLSGLRQFSIPGGDMKTYTLRRDSIVRVDVGGRPGVERMADYRANGQGAEPAGTPMVEIISSVATTETGAFFYARVSADRFAAFYPRYKALLAAARVP